MSFRGKNPSRPSNTGFKVVPAHAPHSAYLGKAKKLKESLIERAKIKKSFAKALKREGLQSERLGGGVSVRGGRGRGGATSGRGRGIGGRPGTGGRLGVTKQDPIDRLVQQARKPTSTATKTAPPESESDESELESGEERLPKVSKHGADVDADAAVDSDPDDGFFDDADMIDSRVSFGRNKGKGRASDDDDDADDDEMQGGSRSRERSRAGPPPGLDEDDDAARLPYNSTRGRGASRGRGRGGASSSTPVYGGGQARPWGTNGSASMSTVTRPKGKKDPGNPNFTFLGGDEGGGSVGKRREAESTTTTALKPVITVDNTPFRGKPLHTHKVQRPEPATGTTTTTANAAESSLRDLKRTAYLGPAKTSGSDTPVHPGRTNRTLQKQQQQQQQARHGSVGGRRGGQPRLGARMGALLQEIERRG